MPSGTLYIVCDNVSWGRKASDNAKFVSGSIIKTGIGTA